MTAAVERTPAPASAGGAWSPFKHGTFRALWIATVASNIGTWMHDVGAGWFMTSLSPSPFMVALVQAATTLPMFLFALPSGVLADIVDRRRFLIAAQLWGLAAAMTLGTLALLGLVTPAILLVATFALGTGAAMNAPAFQAIVPELVPKEEMSSAVALNSMGINVSRAIGPALAGAILSFAGPAVVFLLNALSFLGVLIVLLAWKREATPNRLPPEHFVPAVRAGLRYVREAPALRAVLVRAVAFFAFGSAAWALLPIVTRNELGEGPGGYGILLACIGVGAVTGALLLPRFRARLSADRLTVLATWAFAAATLALAFVRTFELVAVAMLVAGFSWIAMLSTLNVGAQQATAGWVKARALSVFLVVFFGSMAGGSAVWGQVATLAGTPTALALAAVGLVLGSAAALRYSLAGGAGLDLAPSMHWPAPMVDHDPEPDRGPVMVTVEYRIDPADGAAFAAAMADLGRARRRSGALSWGVFEDAAAQGRFLEYFILQSWLEHLRQHERVSRTDQALQERARAFHHGAEPPRVSHFLAPAAGGAS
ncbi:MFS transporter [Skermanella pratensis]|uniref:MFS transporter n=1 Tax=Skermanella pratensis TaxID=2233999 RepID=UPI0013016DE7|nr:MFS transporter [Skermanella pratensis]